MPALFRLSLTGSSARLKLYNGTVVGRILGPRVAISIPPLELA